MHRILRQLMNIPSPLESYKRGPYAVSIRPSIVSRHPTAEECRPLHRNALRAVSTTSAVQQYSYLSIDDIIARVSLVARPVSHPPSSDICYNWPCYSRVSTVDSYYSWFQLGLKY